MIDFGSWALRNRKLVYFVLAVLVVGGVFAYRNMSKLEDPKIVVKQAMVVTTYPGASAHQVELEVTDVLEKSIRTMADVDDVESRSYNDLSIITVQLSTLVGNKEVSEQWGMLRNRVDDAVSKLPSGASKPQVMDTFGDVYGMFYAMTFDGFDDIEASKYAEMVQREMEDIEGVKSIELYGERSECVNIEVSEAKMASLGVHPAEVLQTLNGQNKAVYSGYYESGWQRIRVTVNDKYRSVEDIGNLIIQGHQDDQLRLSDIAAIKNDYQTPVRNSLYYDGRNAIGISIAANGTSDVTKVGKAVESKLAALKKSGRLPAGIEFEKVFFQPERVNKALNTFLVNLIESVAIVIFLLMLTMGFRSGVIIGITLIVVVFGSFMVLNMFDGTLQRVSLGAFIMAMGMLVDNAIVIDDGILVDLHRGVDRKTALTAIGRKTAMPLLGATLIAILAFFPIFVSPDTAGIYVRDLFIVLAVSLLLSWILALTYIPIAADRMLKVTPDSERTKKSSTERYYNALRRVLMWGLTHRTTVIVLAILLVCSSVYCYKLLPSEFFPDMEYDQLYIEYKMPEGTENKKIKEDLDQISGWLKERDEIKHITMSLGGTPSRYNLVRSLATPSLSYGELIVDFTSAKTLVKNMEEIQQYLTTNYPQAYARVKRYNLMYKAYPIEVRFNGPDPAVLRNLTDQAEAIMRNNPTTRLVTNNWEPLTPVMTVDYNQPSARNLGLSRSDVGLSLLTATEGLPTGVFYEGSHAKNIYVKCVDANGEPIDMLDNAPVFALIPSTQSLTADNIARLMTGAIDGEQILESALGTVPLSQTGDGISIDWEDPVVVRYNSQRAMRAQCESTPDVSAETARKAIAEQIEAIELPEGYSMVWEGEHQASTESTRYLFANFPIAIVMMIAILIMLFGDYRKPLMLMCCIPLLAVGVVYGVMLSGMSFGFVAIVGTLGLIGMLIKNGIVLMDEIELQLAAGVEPTKALLDSSASRFRPVMMASLTTILGMIPLLSDCLFGSLAVTIMSGLLVGTLITLIFIPILYTLFFKIKIDKQ